VDISTGDHFANVQTAISNYEDALTILSRKTFPFYWAMAEDGLGHACWQLKGGTDLNFRRSFSSFALALEVRTEKEHPVEWARTEMCRGDAFFNYHALGGESALESATNAYESSLRVFSEHFYALSWAHVQNDLGLMYLEFREGDRVQHLEKARDYISAAARVWTEDRYPEKNRDEMDLLKIIDRELRMIKSAPK
jgi:hypothetical protein